LSTSSADELAKHKLGQDLSRQITRRWKEGDAYAPHDLSWVEMSKWKNRGRPTHDVFDVLDFKPMENYRVCDPVELLFRALCERLLLKPRLMI
jgi:small subunit ribosomal protein S18